MDMKSGACRASRSCSTSWYARANLALKEKSCAAVPPACLLPVLLDIGTTNDALRADPLYLGLRQKPPSEEELDGLVEEFVQAVQQVFPPVAASTSKTGKAPTRSGC
jgi:hypothetical protein